MFKTLKAKVSLVYTSMILVIVLLGAACLFNIMRIGDAVDNLVVTNYNSIQRLSRMQDALNSQDFILQGLVDAGSEQVAGINFQEQTDYFLENYDTERQTIVIPYETQLIEAIGSSYQAYREKAAQLLSGNGTANEEAYYTKVIQPQSQKVRENIEKLVLSNETALFERKAEVARTVRQSGMSLAFFFALVVIIAYFSLRMYTNKLFRPIYDITQNLRAVRQGNLDRKSTVRGTDELGQLAEEFNNMTQRLTEFEQSTLGQLMAEKNRTMAIVRSIAEPLIILDGKHNITLLNQSAEKLFSLSIQDCLGRNFIEAIYHNDLRPELSKLLYQAGNGGETIISSGDDPDARYYNVTITPLRDQGIAPGCQIIVIYDVTELKRLDTMRSDFIATISHEFKTPLTSIIFGADLLVGGTMGALNPEQLEVVDALKEDGQRLNDLVSDLLLLSKIESPSMIYQFMPCKLDDILAESINQFTPIAEQNDIGLFWEPSPDLPVVSADADKIKWVINNLLSNAVKYTSAGGSIVVRSTLVGRNITVEVSDTGTGIPQEFLERIFDKYVQVSTYDLEARGSGLGLAVAKAIITAHGGEIWCTSELGQGSAFFFTLPFL